MSSFPPRNTPLSEHNFTPEEILDRLKQYGVPDQSIIQINRLYNPLSWPPGRSVSPETAEYIWSCIQAELKLKHQYQLAAATFRSPLQDQKRQEIVTHLKTAAIVLPFATIATIVLYIALNLR